MVSQQIPAIVFEEALMIHKREKSVNKKKLP
jgi:hypothetical protein